MSTADQYSNVISPIVVTIANGATESSVAEVHNTSPVGVIFPASMTGTTVTFKVSIDNSTFVPLKYESGIDYEIVVTSSASAHQLDANMMRAWPFIKVVSSASETGAKDIEFVPAYY